MSNYHFHSDEVKDINRILIFTILLNIALVIIKVAAGKISNSNALLADGLHSASDVITSIGVIIGVAMAKKPRDERHQYGHEKIETIVTFLLSIALIYVGGKIGINTILAFIREETMVYSKFALFAALISIFVKEFQYQLSFRVGKKKNSPALIADAWHHRSDALSSIAAFIGIIGAKYGFYLLDSMAGIVVSLIVLKVGVDIFKECFQELSDISICLKEMERVEKLILNMEQVKHIKDMRTRKHGSKVLVDVQICVDPYMEVYKGHQVAEEVEAVIRHEFESVKDVIVHVDPYCEKEKQSDCETRTCKYFL